MSAQLKIIKFKNDFNSGYNKKYLQACENEWKFYKIILKKMTLSFVSLTVPCTEVFLSIFFFYFEKKNVKFLSKLNSV